MKIADVNLHLVPPENGGLHSLSVEGAFLRVRYIQTASKGYNEIDIYLNDQGREVVRTSKYAAFPVLEAKKFQSLEPVGRWYRFKNGILIALQGLEEVFKCLKKQSV